MITFELRCENGHVFEGWFQDSRSYCKQIEEGYVTCPVCDSDKVEKQLSPVAIRTGSVAASKEEKLSAAKLTEIVKAVHERIIRNSENVGAEFASEALKIHYGVAEERNIRGVATADEEKMLTDEGVSFLKIPILEKDDKKKVN